MQPSQTTNRPDKDYAVIKGLVEQVLREVLDIRSKFVQAMTRLDEFDRKLQLIDKIQGLQAKFEEMFRIFTAKCDALARKHDLLEKNLLYVQEKNQDVSKKFDDYQKDFEAIEEKFLSAQAVGKNQIDRLFEVHNKSIDNLKTEWQAALKSLSEKLVVSPKEVWDQNEDHNNRLGQILNKVVLMTEDNQKLKVCFRVLENKIDTVRKRMGS